MARSTVSSTTQVGLRSASKQSTDTNSIVVGTTYKNKPSADVTEAEYMRCFDVNVKSIFWSTKYGIPAIKKGGQGGSMINIASIGSIRPRPGLVWYNSSKGAVSNVSFSVRMMILDKAADCSVGDQGPRCRIWSRSDQSERHLSSTIRHSAFRQLRGGARYGREQEEVLRCDTTR